MHVRRLDHFPILFPHPPLRALSRSPHRSPPCTPPCVPPHLPPCAPPHLPPAGRPARHLLAFAGLLACKPTYTCALAMQVQGRASNSKSNSSRVWGTLLCRQPVNKALDRRAHLLRRPGVVDVVPIARAQRAVVRHLEQRGDAGDAQRGVGPQRVGWVLPGRLVADAHLEPCAAAALHHVCNRGERQAAVRAPARAAEGRAPA
eukprot:40645-Chlamydomonas_euryale.AAC.8